MNAVVPIAPVQVRKALEKVRLLHCYSDKALMRTLFCSMIDSKRPVSVGILPSVSTSSYTDWSSRVFDQVNEKCLECGGACL